MKTDDLNRLLDKYYEGSSSEEEERTLVQFFTGSNIPAGYEAEKEIFRNYSIVHRLPEPSAGFEQRIKDALDENTAHSRLVKRRRLVYSLSGMAATLLILVGSYFFLLRGTEPADTFSDPDLAYAETMKILYNVSSKINNGTQPLNSLQRMEKLSSKSFSAIGRTSAIIEEKMKNLGLIGNAMDMIILPPADSINK